MKGLKNLLVVTTIFILAACGGNGGETSGGASATSGTPFASVQGCPPGRLGCPCSPNGRCALPGRLFCDSGICMPSGSMPCTHGTLYCPCKAEMPTCDGRLICDRSYLEPVGVCTLPLPN